MTERHVTEHFEEQVHAVSSQVAVRTRSDSLPIGNSTRTQTALRTGSEISRRARARGWRS